MNYTAVLPIVGLVKDVILIIGALTTIGLGLYGLRVWKRDLVGKEVYSSIRTVVKNLHKVSKAAYKARMPVHRYEHEQMEPDKAIHFTVNERWRIAEANVYRKRIDDLGLALDALEEALLDARVLVGSSVYASTLVFKASIRLCIDRVTDYLDLLDDCRLSLDEDSPPLESARQALYPAPEMDDDLSQKISDEREASEIALLSFLHRSDIRGRVLGRAAAERALSDWKKITEETRPSR